MAKTDVSRHTLSFSPFLCKILAEMAVEMGYLTEADEPNIPRLIRDGIIRPIVSAHRHEKMNSYKEKEGSTTMDVVRRATHQFIDTEKAAGNRRNN